MKRSPTNRKRADRSIGVIVPAGLGLCREILLGLRSACEEEGIWINVISDTGALPQHGKIDKSRLPPLLGVVAHISENSEFEKVGQISPFVVGTSNRSRPSGGPVVINDDPAIGRMGARYLVSKGFRHLVFLGRRSMHYSRERSCGFAAEAGEAGLACEVIRFSESDQLREIALDLMRLPPPLGLMADSDMTARAFVERMPDARKQIPNRIAVLGVDDDGLQNALSPIGLSSVRTGGREIGYRAARLILRLNEGYPPPADPLRVRPLRVIERASTGVLAIDDPYVLKAVRLIRERPADFRTVGDLVQTLGVHRRTLEIRFRKHLHRTLATEITEARIDAARTLLEVTQQSVAEIAEKVGYSEYRLLTLAFKRVTGESPSAYRRRVR